MKRIRRPKGSVYDRADSPYLWIMYSVNGRKIRENTHQTNERYAGKLLQKRLNEVQRGEIVTFDAHKTTVEQLADMLLRDYRINGRKNDWIPLSEDGWYIFDRSSGSCERIR